MCRWQVNPCKQRTLVLVRKRCILLYKHRFLYLNWSYIIDLLKLLQDTFPSDSSRLLSIDHFRITLSDNCILRNKMNLPLKMNRINRDTAFIQVIWIRICIFTLILSKKFWAPYIAVSIIEVLFMQIHTGKTISITFICLTLINYVCVNNYQKSACQWVPLRVLC